MAHWPVDRTEGRLYVAGVGLGLCRGRTADGLYLVDFDQFDYIVAVVPRVVFELDNAARRPACAYAIEGGRA